MQGAGKRKAEKGKGIKRSQPKPAESDQDAPKKGKKNGKCHFCGKSGHFQKDCLKRKAWFEKKGKPMAFVCFESNLIDVPSNTWWIDSGSNTHVSNTMQGYLTTRTTEPNEAFLYMGNRARAQVEAIGTFCLILDSDFCLDLEETLYISSVSHNLVSL